jgi:hypothetical protein
VQPHNRQRICSAQDGEIRPPRGAARGLETNGRWFRPQQTEGQTGTGSTQSTDKEMAMLRRLDHPRPFAFK